MALVLPVGLSQETAALLPRVRAMVEGLLRRGDRFAALDLEGLAVSRPCDLYVLAVDVDEGRADKVLVGGHALILSGGLSVGFVEYALPVSAEGDAASASVARVGLGERSAAIHRTIEIASGMEAVQRGDFELRLLHVNPLHLSLVWLAGDEDLFLPIEARAGFEAGAVYTDAAMTALALARIEDLIAAHDLMRHLDQRRGLGAVSDDTDEPED